jgi:hypothetical protein
MSIQYFIENTKNQKNQNPIKNRKMIENSKEKNHPLVKTISVALWASTMMKTWQTGVMCRIKHLHKSI